MQSDNTVSTRPRYKKRIRHERILGSLASDSAVRVRELAVELGVSSETIRRDLQELDSAGEIKRTYGGATRTFPNEPGLEERLQSNISERRAIAVAAVRHLDGAEHIFVCGGATAIHFARAMSDYPRTITAVTAAYGVVIELARNPLVQVMALPGLYDANEGIMHGPETLAAIEKYRVPLTVMSASALNASGLSEGILAYAHTHAAMIGAADRVLVLADSTKFERQAFMNIGQWSSKMHLITDAPPPVGLRRAIAEAGVKVDIVP
jgi:DeoR family transcriptional regulator, glycerol-3-phosphate regulon repressor